MSEDLEQQFQTWMEEHPKSWWGVPKPERPHFFFCAGVESQQARIAELEAERDRLWIVAGELLAAVDEFSPVLFGGAEYKEGSRGRRKLDRLAFRASQARAALYPKEESRG